MAIYRITDWRQRYEVNDKGGVAKAQDTLRRTTLPYIRAKNRGRTIGAGFAAMQEIAGDRAYEVSGIFQKFLEIAGVGPPENRGELRNHQDQPASISDLVRMTRATQEQIEHALRVLTDPKVAWIKDDPGISPECGGDSGKIPEPYIDQDKSKSNTEQINTNQANRGISSENDLDLDLKEPVKHKSKHSFLLAVNTIFAPWADAEISTFHALADHLDTLADNVTIFDQAVTLAEEVFRKPSPNNRKGYYIKLCKSNFGFKKTAEWLDRNKKQSGGCDD